MPAVEVPTLQLFRVALFSLLLARLATLPVAAQQTPAPLTVVTHSVGQQAEKLDGNLRGLPKAGSRAFYIELMHALLKELGRHDPIKEVPFTRGLRMVQTEADVVFFNLIRTPDRESGSHWVGPISRQTDYFYERANSTTRLLTMDEARDRPVCVLAGSVHEQAVREQGFSSIHTTSAYANCIRMLIAGRVDLTPSAEDTIQQKLSEAEVKPTLVRQTRLILSRTDGYIALSRSTPAAEVERWRTALKRLKKNGSYDKLYAKYAQ